MIAFTQPFGLHSPGGGPRILRALLEDAPQPFLSVVLDVNPPPPTRLGREVFVPARPRFGRVERTRFQRYAWYAGLALSGRTTKRLTAICRAEHITAIHAIPHGMGFWNAFEAARELGLPYVLNVHDDMTYNLRGRPDLPVALRRLSQVWNQAEARIVISDEMGKEYSRRYGEQPYLIVTDGLTTLPDPIDRSADSLRVYFSGSRHISYEPNFVALMRALDEVSRTEPGLKVSLTSRGSTLPAIPARYPVCVLPWGTEQEISQDLEQADLVYLPLPFGQEFETFSRFSLSTKMVTYLGSGLPILYHGPKDAAAGRLLAQHQAAICLETLDPLQMASTIRVQRAQTTHLVGNALTLGRNQFWLVDQRERFWNLFKTLSDPRG